MSRVGSTEALVKLPQTTAEKGEKVRPSVSPIAGDEAASIKISLAKRETASGSVNLDRGLKDPDELINRFSAGLRSDPDQALQAAGALSAERVKELLK